MHNIASMTNQTDLEQRIDDESDELEQRIDDESDELEQRIDDGSDELEQRKSFSSVHMFKQYLTPHLQNQVIDFNVVILHYPIGVGITCVNREC